MDPSVNKKNKKQLDGNSNIDWSCIEKLVLESDEGRILDDILKHFQRTDAFMTKEEAVIRLLLDLHQPG